MLIQQFDVVLDEGERNVLVKGHASYFPEVKKMQSPEDVVRVMEGVFGLKDKAEEYVYLICMTNRSKAIGFFELSHGTCYSSYVGEREVLIRALLCGAVKIVLVHNHPGGDVTPSKEDVRTTESLQQACRMIRLHLSDHIIISRNGYYSFWEQGKLGNPAFPPAAPPGMSG